MAFTLWSTATDFTDWQNLTKTAPATALRYSFNEHGSCFECSFQLALDIDVSAPSANMGRLVHVFDGLERVWLGQLGDFVRGAPWSFTAVGLKALGTAFEAITTDATGAECALDTRLTGTAFPHMTVDAVIDYAIERGLPWRRAGSFTMPTQFGQFDPTKTVNDLLDAWAAMSNGARWVVDQDGVVRPSADEALPSFVAFPQGTPGGRVFDGYVNAVDVIYFELDDVDGVHHAPYSPPPIRVQRVGHSEQAFVSGQFSVLEHPIDLRQFGTLAVKAARTAGDDPLGNLGRSVLEQVRPQVGATGEYELTKDDVSWFGARSGRYPIKGNLAGRMCLIRGRQEDTMSGDLHAWLSRPFFIAGNEYDVDTDMVRITPPAFVPRDLDAVLTQAVSNAEGLNPFIKAAALAASAFNPDSV